MKKIVYITFLLLITLVNSQNSAAQNKTSLLQDFQEKYIRYEKENKFDSINYLINVYLEKDNLENIEKQLLYYYKGIHYTKIDRNKEALGFLKKSISFENSHPKSEIIKNVTHYFIADAYFTLKDYDNAYKYAEKSKKHLNPEVHTKAYIDVYAIIGYYHFLHLDYEKSIANYTIAKKTANKYFICKVAEIDVKIAKVLNRKKDFYAAKKTIERAIKMSDSCNEPINKLNALKTLREILIENKEFEAAENTFGSIEKLVTDNNQSKRDKKIDSLETVYKTKIKEQQNKELRKINIEKESNLKKQKMALIGLIVGILALSGLLYYVFRLTQKQKQTNKELHRLNLLNQKIFSVISHDFKGPITSLNLLLSKNELLPNENHPFTHYISDIKNQLNQSETILNSLLDWAKAELLIETTNLENIPVKEFIQSNLTEFENKISEKNIVIHINISENEQIDFNYHVLKIVFRNLISNALKYSSTNSEIEISWKSNTIQVTDTGKGLDEKTLKNIFKQNVNSRLGTNLETGFGIGLYLSNELLLKNNGHLSAKNNPITGSTFTIHFEK